MESANKHQQKQTRGIKNELLRCLRVSVAPGGGTWEAQGGHFGSLGASRGSPEGSLELLGSSLGGSGGVPGAPCWGPWGGLGRFWGALG